MEIKLTVNGKEVALTEEQIKLLELWGEKDNPVQRKIGERYYHIEGNGSVYYERDINDCLTDNRFNVGNYCTDKALIEQRALHETLSRLLWRASIEAGELDNPWDTKHQHYYIGYRLLRKDFLISTNSLMNEEGKIYFPTKDSATKALEEIVKPFMKEHPEFVW